MSRRYFGTDGVRGPYGSATMNERFAWRLGVAAARFVRTTQTPATTMEILIGRDTRASGPLLEQALAAGLAHEGLTGLSLGVVPTPAVSLLARQRGAALGVVITASHNPASDNGIKFFGPSGTKLTDEEELAMEQLLPSDDAVPAEMRSGLAALPGALGAYLAMTTALLPAGCLAGWRIVLDTAHGATCESSRQALTFLGADLDLIGNAPDGNNINDGVGSQHPEAMSAAVLASGARLGIAHDGDGDRCILCDERGEVLDGDEILTLLALHADGRGQLVRRTLVVTMQSNLGVDAALHAVGARVCRTTIGDRYVIERMLADGATLGGESSGHIICSEVAPTGDGLVAALKVIEVMRATGQPLSQLRRALRKFPLLTEALAVREKKPLASLPRLLAAIERVEATLGSAGRVLVRYSGTEPKLRFLVEGPTEEQVAAGMGELTAAARVELDVIKA